MLERLLEPSKRLRDRDLLRDPRTEANMAVYPTSKSDQRIAPDPLRGVVSTIFERCGMLVEDATLLAETLVHSDIRGVHSHGVLRVPDYVMKLTKGGVNPRGQPQIVSERGAAIVVDGGNSMGQIGGTFAMRRVVERARELGLAFAAVRGSNHCGAMDWYTLIAAKEGLIGIAGTDALPTMAPWGGMEKIVGINPLSIALPTAKHPAFVIDFAFGATAHGKIRVYHQKGSPIPPGWAFDEHGRTTTDAATALKGLIQPIGEHKGVGLAMAVGLLASMLSGASYGTELGNMVDGPKAGCDGHFFAAIDVSAFEELSEFKRRMDWVIDQVHYSGRRPGVERLYVPGEIEADFEARYRRDGILLSAATVNDLLAAATSLNVDATNLAQIGPR
jgi:L-2-hydroxycarboxylate dehydrogenase (NAD+)